MIGQAPSTRSGTMPTQPAETHGPITIVAVVLEVILGIGALGGGLALMLGPHGEILPFPVSELRGSPFDTFFVPGLILFSMLGIGPIVVAVLAWRRDRWAPLLTVGVAATLLIWMGVEIAVVGYFDNPPLQPIYIGLGIIIGAVGISWLRRSGLPFSTPRS
jgi:hypothetical protein